MPNIRGIGKMRLMRHRRLLVGLGEAFRIQKSPVVLWVTMLYGVIPLFILQPAKNVFLVAPNPCGAHCLFCWFSQSGGLFDYTQVLLGLGCRGNWARQQRKRCISLIMMP